MTILALSKYKLFDPYDSIDIKSVFNAVNSMVIIFSPDLYSKYYNPEVNKKLLNKESGERPIHVKELFGDNHLGFLEFEKNILEPVQSGNKILEYETVFTGTCGRKINILLSAQPILNNRKTQFLLFVCHDITSRVSAELELIRSNERYAFVTKATNEAIRDWNITEDILTWEEGIDTLFGLQIPQVDTCQNNWLNFIHPEDRDRVSKDLDLQLKEKMKNQWNAEYRFLKKDGNYAFVEDKAFIIRDMDDRALRMIGAIRDVSSQKEYLKAIETKNMQLEEISWIQSHKVRAPLANIMGLISILTEDNLSQNEKICFLEKLKTSSMELDAIIHQIVSKAELAEKPSEFRID